MTEVCFGSCEIVKFVTHYYTEFQEIASNSVFQEYGILGLFLNALLSATAIPLPTEVLTSALLAGGESILNVSIVLVIGSTIGGLLNYVIGFGGGRFAKWLKKTVKHDDNKHNKDNKKSHKILTKLGWTGIFFSPFIPVLGDLILISAGAKKMNFRKFLLFMVAGKVFKTVVVVLGLGALLL